MLRSSSSGSSTERPGSPVKALGMSVPDGQRQGRRGCRCLENGFGPCRMCENVMFGFVKDVMLVRKKLTAGCP